MKRLTQRLGCILLAALLSVSLVACGGQSPESGDGNSVKDTLTVVMPADPGSLDPMDNVSQNKHQSTRQIYETLVAYNENAELIPWLAESWEFEDGGKTIILHIRKGVKFHNGDELKASDVLFSLKRARIDNTPAAMQVDYVDFEKSEVVDDYTVKLVLKEVFALQLAMLELPLCAIISERAYTESGGDFFAQPIGTGPYKVVKFNSGDSLELVAHEDYWIEGQPYIKNLLIRYIGDASARAIEAESGGADIVYEISANDIDRVRENPNINLVSAMGANTSYLTINQAVKPLDNIKVREAIWYAVDIPAAIDVAYGNFGEVATGIISPGIDGRHPDLSSYFPKQDLERARACMEEAGYADGFHVKISCNSSDQQRKDFIEVIQSQLAAINIDVEIDVMDSTTWASQLANGEGQLSAYGYTASTGEAGRVLFRWLPDKSEWPLFSWDSPEYYDVINEALVTIDTEARNQLFYECQEMLMENYVALPIWHKELNAACQPHVKGFRIMPSYEHHLLQYVYFE
jgi:peptide/nickel transport system substrate-binding protein